MFFQWTGRHTFKLSNQRINLWYRLWFCFLFCICLAKISFYHSSAVYVNQKYPTERISLKRKTTENPGDIWEKLLLWWKIKLPLVLVLYFVVCLLSAETIIFTFQYNFLSICIMKIHLSQLYFTLSMVV